jgi:hypothetical protein
MQDLFNFLEIASEQTATRGSHCSEVTGVSPVGGQVVACRGLHALFFAAPCFFCAADAGYNYWECARCKRMYSSTSDRVQ